MIRNAKKYERVKYWGSSEESFKNGKIIAYWPESVTTGTIIGLIKYKHYNRYLVVQPDPPGFGAFWIQPKQLERISEKS